MDRTWNVSRVAPISEREFTTTIRDGASSLGWLRYHTWLAKHSTPGFPDEVLVRPPRLIFAELKSETGTLSVSQETWLDALRDCGQEVYLWRPPMIDAILRTVLGRGARPSPSEEIGSWL